MAEGNVLDFRMSTPAGMAVLERVSARLQPIMRSNKVWAWTMVVGWKVIICQLAFSRTTGCFFILELAEAPNCHNSAQGDQSRALASAVFPVTP